MRLIHLMVRARYEVSRGPWHKGNSLITDTHLHPSPAEGRVLNNPATADSTQAGACERGKRENRHR